MSTLITLISFAVLAFFIWDAYETKKEKSRKSAWIYKKFGQNIYSNIYYWEENYINYQKAEQAWSDWKLYGIDVPDFTPSKIEEEKSINPSKENSKKDEEFLKKAAEYYMEHGKNFWE